MKTGSRFWDTRTYTVATLIRELQNHDPNLLVVATCGNVGKTFIDAPRVVDHIVGGMNNGRMLVMCIGNKTSADEIHS